MGQRFPNTLALARLASRGNPPKWWDLKMLSHEFFPAKVSLRPFVSPLKVKSLSPPRSLARYQIIFGGPKLVHKVCRLTSARRGRMGGSCNSIACKET